MTVWFVMAVVYAWAYQVKAAAFEVYRVVVLVVDACPCMGNLLYCAQLVACVVDPFLLLVVVAVVVASVV